MGSGSVEPRTIRIGDRLPIGIEAQHAPQNTLAVRSVVTLSVLVGLLAGAGFGARGLMQRGLEYFIHVYMGVVVVAVAIVIMTLRRRTTTRATARSIHGAEENQLVRIGGRVKAIDTFRSGLSGQEVVLAKYRVEFKAMPVERTCGVDFLVVSDDGHQALVRVDDSYFAAIPEEEHKTPHAPESVDLPSLLEGIAPEWASMIAWATTTGATKYLEVVLKPGDTVEILGFRDGDALRSTNQYALSIRRVATAA